MWHVVERNNSVAELAAMPTHPAREMGGTWRLFRGLGMEVVATDGCAGMVRRPYPYDELRLELQSVGLRVEKSTFDPEAEEGSVALAGRVPEKDTCLVVTSRSVSSAPAGYRFPREMIALAVRWYLRYGLSYRDVEELIADAASKSTTSRSTGGFRRSRRTSSTPRARPGT
jgi:hypothetical protein